MLCFTLIGEMAHRRLSSYSPADSKSGDRGSVLTLLHGSSMPALRMKARRASLGHHKLQQTVHAKQFGRQSCGACTSPEPTSKRSTSAFSPCSVQDETSLDVRLRLVSWFCLMRRWAQSAATPAV